MDATSLREKTDAYLDGELSLSEEARLRSDPDVSAEFDAADEVRRILSGEFEGEAVPLKAQAAWRSAVRREAKAARIRRGAIRMGSAAAAVAVLALSSAFLFGSEKSPIRSRKVDLSQANGTEEAVAAGAVYEEPAKLGTRAPLPAAVSAEDAGRVQLMAVEVTPAAGAGTFAAKNAPAGANFNYTQASGFGLRAAKTLSNDVNRPASVTLSVPDSDMNTMLRTVEDKARETGGSVWSYTVCEEDDECEIVASVSASQLDEFMLMLGSDAPDEEREDAEEETCKVVIRFSETEAAALPEKESADGQ